ncbi:MAG: ABC transporter permease [Acidobacteria bacterium]|nr:ABC transporter permease [Acidobacteriota bacterium]
MTALKLIFTNVIHRPVRAFVGILAISLEVTLILLVIGISNGMIHDNADRQENIGADIIVRPANAPPLFFTTGSTIIPESMGETLRRLESVREVTPILFLAQLRGSWRTVYGIDLPSFEVVAGSLEFLEGRGFSGPQAPEAIIDDLHARSKDLAVGDRFDLKGESFQVVGIYRNGIGGRVYLPIRSLQAITDKAGQASTFLVKLYDSEQIQAAMAQMQGLVPNISIASMREWVSLLRNSTPPAYDTFISGVVGVAISIGSFACFLSMYTTIAERTREIGILKSLGARKGYIVKLVLMEVLVLCLSGLLAGFLLTFLGQQLLQFLFPAQILLIPPVWVLFSVLFVSVSGIIGGLYPALKAAASDPVKALSYE